jgi:7,8-dihydroneopterin aldolase/epimerase/oxygenase
VVMLRGIAAETLVGVRPRERLRKRTILVDLELTVDLADAARSDRLVDTVDYSSLTRRVRELCAGSSFLLIEALAARVAELCLEEPRVAVVTVTLHKPDAVAGVADVAVRVTRGARELASQDERPARAAGRGATSPRAGSRRAPSR